jgi:hypothetical protein
VFVTSLEKYASCLEKTEFCFFFVCFLSPSQMSNRQGYFREVTRRLYARGRFDNEPSKEAALEDRVRKVEQLVGRPTLENEFFKKAVQRGLLSPPKKSDGSLLSIVTSSKTPKEGADS